MRRKLSAFCFFCLVCIPGFSLKCGTIGERKKPPFLSKKSVWAKKILQTLSLEEKIAQLFVASIPINGDEKNTSLCERLIRENGIGGIFLSGKGVVEKQIGLINRLQKITRVPLLVGQDLEWGPAMRLTDGMSWPKAMVLGAIADDRLIYQTARTIAGQARALGVHITASPVLDINTNPHNPVINVRSFGSCQKNVERKALAFMRGLHDGGILACGKHFPGHGDTHIDSHVALPVVLHDKKRLFSVELAPFKTLIDNGISLIMAGHLAVPALDPSGSPATFSYPLITGILKKKLGFGGLVISDALNMQALPVLDPTEINVRAVTAGTDLLIFATKIPESIARIKQMVRQKQITESDITARVYKILCAKEWLGLATQNQVDPAGINKIQENVHDNKLKKKLYEHALTCARDAHNVFPLSGFLNAGRKKILLIEFGSGLAPFAKNLKAIVHKYTNKHVLDNWVLDCNWRENISCLKNYDLIVVTINTKLAVSQGILHDASHNKTYSGDLKADISDLCAAHKNCLCVLFASPYELLKLPRAVPALIAYEPEETAQKVAASTLIGRTPIRGKLPVAID